MNIDTNSEQLIASKDIEIVERAEGRFEAIHRPSAKMYAITEDIAHLLRRLNAPAYMQEIYGILGDTYEKTAIDQAVTALRNKKLIVSESEEDAYVTTLPRTGLFGVKEHTTQTKERSIVLAGIPFGYGNGDDIRCQLFPAYLRSYVQSRKIDLVKQAEPIDYRFISSITDFSPLRRQLASGAIQDIGDLHLTSHESPAGVYQKIYRLASDIIGEQSVPLFIGGDHSITLPAIRAAAASYDAIQLLQFDAHTDTYSPVSQRDFTHHHGNFISEVFAMDNVKKVVQIGLRGFANRMSHLTNHAKQTTCWAGDLQEILYRNGADLAIDTSLPTYITFDIDFIDPAFAPGTATPVPNGFSYYETCVLFDKLFRQLNIIGADVVEVNPKLDHENKTIEIAAYIILLLMNYINVSR